MNHVVLIGRVSSDVKLLYTQKGRALANFDLAVRRTWTEGGQRTADFVQVVSFGKIAEASGKYLRKGRLVAVKGRLNTRHYERDGVRRKVIEIVAEHVRFLDAPDPAGVQSSSASP